VNYAESDEDEDDEEVFKPVSSNRRAGKRRRIEIDGDSDDEFGFDQATQAAMEEMEGMLFFLLPLLIRRSHDHHIPAPQDCAVKSKHVPCQQSDLLTIQ
jgi:hypothetical protein